MFVRGLVMFISFCFLEMRTGNSDLDIWMCICMYGWGHTAYMFILYGDSWGYGCAKVLMSSRVQTSVFGQPRGLCSTTGRMYKDLYH